MEDNRPFKFLRRANTIFVFSMGALLLGIFAMSALALLAEVRGSDTTSGNAQHIEGKEDLRLETPSHEYRASKAEGFVYFELRSGRDYYAKFSSGERSQLRNIGAFDLNTDEVQWVFPDAGQVIEGFYAVTKASLDESNMAKTVTTGFLLTVAKSLADERVERDLWVMAPSGKDVRKILTDISRRPEIETYGESQIKLIFSTGSKIEIYPFDVDALSIGAPTEVTIP